MVRVVVTVALALVLGAGAVAAALLFLSGVTLRNDPVALARLSVQTFGGKIEHVAANGADGAPIAISVAHGRLTPLAQVAPGERITVTVAVKRPGWSAWLLGKTRRENLTVVAPSPQIRTRWVTARDGRAIVRFDTPLERSSVAGKPTGVNGRTVSIAAATGAGAARVAVAARTWERLGTPERVTWFPATTHDAVLVEPKPGAEIGPVTPVRLTFSRTVSDVLGTKHPTFAARVTGRWLEPDSHTLVFRPSGYGFGFASTLRIRLPSPEDVLPAANAAKPKAAISWSTAPASFMRLQQLLAQEGYLPLDWTPAAGDPAHTMRAEMQAAINPPAGRFTWRYPNTPQELQALWEPGRPNTIVRGAVMMFEDEHGLAVDGIAGARVWQAVLADAAAGKRRTAGYSYVYVHRAVPQLLTLWHAGKIVLTSPGNTGVPAAPTTLGTFPVFEHIPVGRMSGINPDGSHYDDPGIRWISYFHQGEALHAFNRASFGTPQSLGCVELPLDAAAKVWPYTPIGTLVTIEN